MQHDIGVFESHGDFERKRDARKYFWSVIRAYVEVLEMPPLTAISYDPNYPNRRLGPQTIEFKTDVENATKVALDNNPSLFDDWNRLIRGENVSNANEIIVKCARLYRSRQLIPHFYFVTIKRGRNRQADSVGAA